MNQAITYNTEKFTSFSFSPCIFYIGESINGDGPENQPSLGWVRERLSHKSINFILFHRKFIHACIASYAKEKSRRRKVQYCICEIVFGLDVGGVRYAKLG
jgi:hypothetical protein